MKKYAIRVKFNDVDKFKNFCSTISAELINQMRYLDNNESTLFTANMRKQDALALKITLPVEIAEMFV